MQIDAAYGLLRERIDHGGDDHRCDNQEPQDNAARMHGSAFRFFQFAARAV
jgi:hypothetical protein